MRPRKGYSYGRSNKPQQKPPWNPEESSRRDDYSPSRHPRKKILILDKEEKETDRPTSGVKKVYRKSEDSETRRPERPSPGKRRSFGEEKEPDRTASGVKKVYRKTQDSQTRRPERPVQGKRRSFGEEKETDRTASRVKKVYRKTHDSEAGRPDRPSPGKRRSFGTKPDTKEKRISGNPGYLKKQEPDLIRLNKFIANAGICSRREADELIRAGAIKVNGKIVSELGVKVSRNDKIQYGDETLRAEPLIYVLLNKPKGYITTVDDPFERNTVMSLVKDAAKYRIYPVGRLDRNTTGLLLFTNDGDLAKKMTHPRHRIEKLYHVEVDKNLTKNDMLKIAAGIQLEDGFIKVDEIAYVAGADSKKEIGIRLHSGQNRVVRRLFEALGYQVTRLDRVIFAGLTKKDLPRGKWRFLKTEEVNRLKRL